MTDAVLSQIEQVLQGIETRTPRCCDQRCYVNSRDEYAPMHSTSCEAIHAVSVRTEIARTVERMLDAAIWDVIPELTEDDTASPTQRQIDDAARTVDKRHRAKAWAASIRAAGGTEPQ